MSTPSNAFSVSTMQAALKAADVYKKITYVDDVAMEWIQVPDCKYTVKLDLISATPSFVANGPNWSGTGNVTITEKSKNVNDVKAELSLWKRSLEQKFATANVTCAMKGNLDPYQMMIEQVIVEPLANSKQSAMWFSSSTFSTYGIIDELKADSARLVTASYSGATGPATSAVTVSTIDEFVDAFVARASADIISQPNLKLYIGANLFSLFLQNQRAAFGTLAMQNVEQAKTGTMRYSYLGGPFSLEIVGVKALNDTTYGVLTSTDNLYHLFNCSDQESVASEYNFEHNMLLFRVEGQFAATYGDAALIVTNF